MIQEDLFTRPPQRDDFGTEPRKLVRRESPVTSVMAAESVNTGRWEMLVYDAIKGFGSDGCISDEVLECFKDARYSTITPRYKALKEKGLIEVTGEKRPGHSERLQQVMRVR